MNCYYVTEKKHDVTIFSVEENYLFHPACRAKPGNETTILAEQKQLETFLNELKLQNPTEPKFPTECFWITMLYHHIGLVPATRRLTRTALHCIG